jgi:hypothetical protein
VTVCPFRLDQPVFLVEAKSGVGDSGPARHVADAEEFFRHLVTP